MEVKKKGTLDKVMENYFNLISLYDNNFISYECVIYMCSDGELEVVFTII